MDQGLNQKIDAYIAENKEQLLQDIAALVAIDSVEGTPEEGAPFGKGPRAALDKTLELAAGMGLATRNCENYMGYAELAGADPEKYLATICHVDVVPVGNGWTADPFKMRIQDGWLLGRGVSDDKAGVRCGRGDRCCNRCRSSVGPFGASDRRSDLLRLPG